MGAKTGQRHTYIGHKYIGVRSLNNIDGFKIYFWFLVRIYIYIYTSMFIQTDIFDMSLRLVSGV